MTSVYSFGSETYGDVTFENDVLGSATGLVAYGDDRLVIEGVFSLNLVESKKFGKQIQFQIFSDKFRVEKRNKSRWNRTEIYFPISQLPALISLLQKKMEGVVVNG